MGSPLHSINQIFSCIFTLLLLLCYFFFFSFFFWSLPIIALISLMQRWWRSILLIKSRTESVILIQAHVRGWIARQGVARDKHDIVIIQVRCHCTCFFILLETNSWNFHQHLHDYFSLSNCGWLLSRVEVAKVP